MFKFLIIALISINSAISSDEESFASEYIDQVCESLLIENNIISKANWQYESNVTDANEKIKNEQGFKYAEFSKSIGIQLRKFNYENYKNETLKRLIRKLVIIGDGLLSEKDFRELNAAVGKMQSNYAKVKLPKYDNKNIFVSLEPEITEIFETSRDPIELEYYWNKWYDLAGTPCKNDFFKYVELRNKAAQLNNFANGAEVWLDAYEDENFESQIEEILEQIKPLYEQLHGYVRHKLHEFYGPKHVDLKKPIPMHLCGNLWGQAWEIVDIVLPYKNATRIDFTKTLLCQKYTPKRIFKDAEEFFTSINLAPMTESFWSKSIIEKPNDGREMVCHASAWDFAINDDVRIKQCTRITMESYITVHHEMGHVEYYLQYRHQPIPFRDGANPGFHEAIGDTISLSVSSPKHLHRMGLIRKSSEDRESLINQLINVAMRKLAFLPFGYVMDKFRYEIFRGNIQPENANCHFWRLREKYGGIGPASVRGARDFDITAKYHASADIEYMRYFVSTIIQFQFHKAACIKAGEYEPNNPTKSLNNCDIYQSNEAGNAIKKMLSLGSSKPWPDVLEVMTGERKLNADAFLEYFKPLEQWLLETNRKLGVNVGWDLSDKIDCPKI